MATERGALDQWNRIQRGVLISLALAVLGLLIGITLNLVPVHVLSGRSRLSCGSPSGWTRGDSVGFQGFEGTQQIGPASTPVRRFVACADRLRRRRGAALVIGAVLDIPLIYFAIRGLLWGGKSIAILRERAEGIPPGS
jgi:hypothetical protein